MADGDRVRWDERYRQQAQLSVEDIAPPRDFSGQVELFPSRGDALDLACGRGTASLWLAKRGLHVHAIDIATEAIAAAMELAATAGLDARCRFEVDDLDQGLPPGDPVDLILCHRFRDPGLYTAIADRLRVGGILAISVLTTTIERPARFRAPPGELRSAFSDLEVLHHHQADDVEALVARSG